MIAVLWIVAALSVMVTGLTQTVRQQIQAAATLRDQVTGQAAGESAIALVLQTLVARNQRINATVSTSVAYGGADIKVDVAPLEGWISLNGASEPLLASLLVTVGRMDAGGAQALAARLVKWRDGAPELDPTAKGGVSSQPRRFEAPEDLLLVPGFDYMLYSRIAPLVSADLAGASQVNPLAAPPEVLAVLAQGDAAQVRRFVAQRDAGPGADTSIFNSAFVGGGGTDLYRLRAQVPLEEGKILLLTRDVALGAMYSTTAPWRILRTDRQVVGPVSG